MAGFVSEFVRGTIERFMVKPEDRRAQFEAHIAKVSARAQQTCARPPAHTRARESVVCCFAPALEPRPRAHATPARSTNAWRNESVMAPGFWKTDSSQLAARARAPTRPPFAAAAAERLAAARATLPLLAPV